MGKNKQKKFDENKILPNVIQPTREEVISGYEKKGNWSSFFKKESPLVLELGCGKGEYSVGLAEKFPDKNFIGIDIKGARFWYGAKEAIHKGLENVAFLRTQIELLDHIFAPGEISEIWITFPDPQMKYRRTKHRLTNPDFLRMYQKLLKPGGVVHLKTDSEFLHGYTLGVLQGMGTEILTAHHDIYGAPEYEPGTPLLRDIQTYYENLFSAQGKKITYLKFRFAL